jgi:leucyl/phenylalanyl-tRNA---protein transferase
VVPVDPPPSRWRFDVSGLGDDGDDLVGLGADLEPGTLLSAYRQGLFPMPYDVASERSPIGWWSPVRRGVLLPGGVKVSKSLRRSRRDFEIRVDTAFAEVVDGCADPGRPHGWIDRRIREAYVRLHELGWAHSVEAWCDGTLAGGLYGIAVGGLFAGESMFHRRRDASKVALVGLVELLGERGWLVDTQWSTSHLASLGVQEIDRRAYLARLPRLVELPLPTAFA